MKSIKFISIFILILSATPHAMGASRGKRITPFALSLAPKLQFPSSSFTIKGLRLGLMSNHRRMSGIDVGLIGNATEQSFSGLAVGGLYNYNREDVTVTGLQLAGLANINKSAGTVYGIQASLGANIGKYTDVYGVQIGLYNRARNVRGLQIGLVNHASNLKGIQIGLANFNNSGPYTVSPLINLGW